MRSVQYATHVFRLMCHGSRFPFSCSCSQCTCPKLSLHLSNYSGYECAQVFLSYFSLVTGALALTIRVISVGWLESHLPSAPSDFFAANFRVTHLTVSCGAVPVSFNWSWLSSQLQLLFENYGWQCILHFIKSRCRELVLSRVALRMFCSCLIAQLNLLLLLASVHKAMRRVWMQICSATVSLSTCNNAIGDAFWSNLFRDNTVSCTSVIRLLPV